MKPRASDPQFDLFVPYVADMGLRDQRETMERPFFSLAKRKRLKAIEYTSPDQSVFVNVLPHQEFGMATIWDADILIWAASTIQEMKRRGVNDLPRTLNFQPYDLLRAIGRQTGGNRYARLREALSRLQTTTINTNLRVANGKKTRQFSWIDSWSELTDENGENSRGMTLTLSEWFYEGVMMDGGVLSIDFDYFAITGGRERWLYRVARKHAGGAGASGFKIGLETLFEKAGAEGTFRRFKHEIAKVVKTNELPGYELALVEGRGQPSLLMKRKDATNLAQEPVASTQPSSENTVTTPQSEAAITPQFSFFLQRPTEETIALVRRKFPTWDVYALQAEFDEWIGQNPAKRQPSDYQKAFYGFVRQWDARERS